MCVDDSPSSWKDLYVAAILEIDNQKILARIREAKMAICDRVEELGGGGKAAERIALNQAMKALSELQSVYEGEPQMPPKLPFRRSPVSIDDYGFKRRAGGA